MFVNAIVVYTHIVGFCLLHIGLLLHSLLFISSGYAPILQSYSLPCLLWFGYWNAQLSLAAQLAVWLLFFAPILPFRLVVFHFSELLCFVGIVCWLLLFFLFPNWLYIWLLYWFCQSFRQAAVWAWALAGIYWVVASCIASLSRLLHKWLSLGWATGLQAGSICRSHSHHVTSPWVMGSRMAWQNCS